MLQKESFLAAAKLIVPMTDTSLIRSKSEFLIAAPNLGNRDWEA